MLNQEQIGAYIAALPEACRYQHGGRSGQQERGRNDEGS